MFEVSSSIGSLRSPLRQAAARLVLVAAIAGLAGCNLPNPINGAVDLYHGLQGGAIAEQRPPPPGADSPYPKLATMPSRPPAPDVAAEQRIADQLATQRDAASVAAAKSPLTTFTAPAPPPKPTPAAAPDPNANRVVVDAAASPAVTPTPPAPAPAPSAMDSVPAVPASVTSGPLPSFAAAPPAPASGLGVLIPPAPPPASPSAAPTVPAPAPAPAAGTTVAIVFTPGSSTLPPSATLNLRRFALAHKGVPLNVTGQGDAVLLSADAQARALDLALHRAQAIAASLAQAGVPAVNLHLHAQASGSGGSASL